MRPTGDRTISLCSVAGTLNLVAVPQSFCSTLLTTVDASRLLHAAVGNPAVTVFPPGDDDGPTVIDSTNGGPVPYIIPPPLIGGGDTPYDTKVRNCACLSDGC
jgi:hypothetical protein